MSSGNKSEKPTPKKLSDAKKKGQVPRSKELASALIMTAFLILFYVAFPYFMGLIKEMLNHVLSQSFNPFSSVLSTTFELIFKNSIKITLPIIVVMVIVTVLGTLAQGGFVFSFHPLMPKLENISPGKTLKQIFSFKNVIEFVKSLFKATILGIIIYHLVVDNYAAILRLPYCGLDCIMQLWGYLALMMLLYCAVFYMAIAIFDAVFQHYQHIKSLKMTPEEVKQEFKEMEGNYEIKGMRTSMYREIISEGLQSDVQNSSVVVTNPTHLAIGLFYEKGKTGLPVITLKETDEAALAARRLAEKMGIPVVQNIPLARKLMAKGTKKDRIPNELIADVAKVIRWVMKIQKKKDRQQ